MEEKIYIGFISYNDNHYWFKKSLIDYLKGIKISNNVILLDIVNYPNPLAFQIYKNVCYNNDDDKSNITDRYESIFMLEFTIKTESSILFKELKWLEKELKKFVTEIYNDFTGIYFSYLIKDNDYTFKKSNILKGKHGIIEDDTTDDFSFLDNYSKYMKTLLYHPDKIEAVEKLYPSETAFLLLGLDRIRLNTYLIWK